MIVVVDYGMGNLASIVNMLKKGGTECVVSSDPMRVGEAEKLILPGVGAFDTGMKNLAERKLIEPLNRAVLERKAPVLGLCLGMQLMTKRSAEGLLAGLGWFDAETVRFRFQDPSLKVPHMGWNTMRFTQESFLEQRLDADARFYFVHSFYVICNRPSNVLGVTTYGHEFACALVNDNMTGVQFHPEKSHRFGLQLLRNFAELTAPVTA